MRKAIIIFLILTIVGLSFVSCMFDDTHYCPYCGSTNIKEDGRKVINGQEFQIYKCQRATCEARFLVTAGGKK
jgi:transposase-like protein